MQLVLRKRLERAQLEHDIPATMDDATLAFFVMAVHKTWRCKLKQARQRRCL
jgi:hypothetical protein